MGYPCDYCDSQYCYVVCSRCRGTGKTIDFIVGLGMHGLAPCYAETICKGCDGEGVLYCDYY